MRLNFNKKLFLILVLLLFLPFFISADIQGDTKTFFVDPTYDLKGREKVTAALQRISDRGYFYLEKEWYDNLTEGEKEEVKQNLVELSQEFDNTIYPQLTSTFGQEWNPGIDNDSRITILFHRLKKGTAGYFRSENEYPKIQSLNSNEREMVYLAAESLNSEIVKSYLAHEFTHLITFNQKERIRGKVEEIWLNELRAEYAPTLLGYDDEYQGSNLQQRVRQFISSPSDSLTEWQNQKADYGVINLFGQYLVDHYGVQILVDSLKSKKTGIESINESLKKHDFKEDFSQIFTDWTITLFLNDCDVNAKYCYKNQNLKGFKITPSLILLPSTQKTQFSLSYSTKEWSGNWYQILGEEGKLNLKFNGAEGVKFKVPYILCQDTQNCQVNYLKLNEEEDGEISFKDFGKEWTSLTLIPSIQPEYSTLNFNGEGMLWSFSLFISMETKGAQEKLIEELKAQISALKARIAELKAKIAEILKKRISCQKFENNLYYGMKNEEVRCLQEFLRAQGEKIYPEGLVTGFFGPLTRAAVIRFQEKYASEILEPLGLSKGTGFVGPSTRDKLNQLLAQ